MEYNRGIKFAPDSVDILFEKATILALTPTKQVENTYLSIYLYIYRAVIKGPLHIILMSPFCCKFSSKSGF